MFRFLHPEVPVFEFFTPECYRLSPHVEGLPSTLTDVWVQRIFPGHVSVARAAGLRVPRVKARWSGRACGSGKWERAECAALYGGAWGTEHVGRSGGPAGGLRPGPRPLLYRPEDSTSPTPALRICGWCPPPTCGPGRSC